MTTNSIKVKATTLKKFLNNKGHTVKHSECLEAVSIMETGQNYNVAKDKSIRILKEGKKLTFQEMKNNNFQIDVVIPIDMQIIMDGVEVINDNASEIITGCEYALCDIGYEVYPYFYNKSSMAVRVTGYVEDIDTLHNLDDFDPDFENDYQNHVSNNERTQPTQPIGYVLSEKELNDLNIEEEDDLKY